MENFMALARPPIEEDHYPSATEYNTPLGWEAEVLGRAKKSADMLGLSRGAKWFEPSPENITEIWYTKSSAHIKSFELRKSRKAKASSGDFYIIDYALRKDRSASPVALYHPIQYSLFEEPLWGHVTSIDSVFVQHHLGETRFVPSLELISMWVGGIEEYVEKSKSADEINSHAEIPPGEEARSEFASRFQRMFATIGNLQRRGDEEFACISDGVQFSLNVQHAILDRFHVGPHKHSSFLFLLHMEVRKYVSGGGQIRGKWGHVAYLENKLILECRPVEDLLD